jgi:putative membrane protein
VAVQFLIRTAVTAIGLWVATLIVSGITVTGQSGWADAWTLVLVAVIFGLVNAIIKPLVKLFGCLFYVFTLGLIAFVVNALLFLLVNWLAGLLHLPFHVHGFWSAFWGAIIVGVVSWLINLVIPEPRSNRSTPITD